ncbi:MAG: hypothetical protein IT437_12400 [Phycisphaerales bacterium]|nr:hypothetical protein [Phycisphaerales bacterium]
MRAWIILGVSAAFTAASFGQQRHLERVTPGIDDIGPSSVDPRVVPPDLRQPLGFEGVYRLGERSPWGGVDVRPLVRVSGATIAVFPRSSYVRTREGPRPLIPAGAVFYLGHIPDDLDGSRGRVPPSLLANPLDSVFLRPLDLSIHDGARPGAPAPADASVPTGSLMSSDRYRRARIAELLGAAAGPPATR